MMRGSSSVRLSIIDKRQLNAWSSSEPYGSVLARNSRIVLGLADGKTINQISAELNICRQTVSRIRHRFMIFGLEGIKSNAPKLGRKSAIGRETADEILYTPLFEIPEWSNRWTGQQLAWRCRVPDSTLYRFLNRMRVSLGMPKTIRDVTNVQNLEISDIAGLFLSPMVNVFAFSDGTG